MSLRCFQISSSAWLEGANTTSANLRYKLCTAIRLGPWKLDAHHTLAFWNSISEEASEGFARVNGDKTSSRTTCKLTVV